MAKILWDQTGDKKYETGVDHGVLYVKQDTPVTVPLGDNKTSVGTKYHGGVAWNGLTSVSKSPSGAEANDLWADNIKYASLRSAETFGGTIEAYTYPDAFAECDGSKSIASTGVGFVAALGNNGRQRAFAALIGRHSFLLRRLRQHAPDITAHLAASARYGMGMPQEQWPVRHLLFTNRL